MHGQLRTAISGMEVELLISTYRCLELEPDRSVAAGLPTGGLNAECCGWSGWASWSVDYDFLGSSAEIVQAHSMTCRVAVVRSEGCQRRVRPHDVSIWRVGSPPDIVMQFHSTGAGGGNPAQRPVVASPEIQLGHDAAKRRFPVRHRHQVRNARSDIGVHQTRTLK